MNGSTSYTLAPRGAPHNALEAILEATRARPSGRDRWTGHCPAHEDRDPSLSIRVASEGRVLLYCFAGCPFEAIVAALGLEARDLMGEGAGGPWSGFGARPYPWPCGTGHRVAQFGLA